MECKNIECLCYNNCIFFNKCILDNALLQSNLPYIIKVLQGITGQKKRVKAIINFLQQQQPPKVSRLQIERWYSLLKRGINLDWEGKYVNLVKREKKIRIGKKHRQFTDAPFIMFAKIKCSLVGFLKCDIGHGLHQYTPAYYDATEERYVFVVKGVAMAYYKKTIAEYVQPFEQPGKKKEIIPVNIREETLDEKVNRMLRAPGNNFHLDFKLNG